MPGKNLCRIRRLSNLPPTFIAAFLTLFLLGCTQSPRGLLDQAALYIPPAPASITEANTPAFLLKEPSKTFNQIGTPSVAAGTGQEPEIFVTPEKPAVFFESQKFSTTKGVYTNIIYRIHFPEVPLSWASLNLTAGRNPGLLFIYTLDESGTLLLVTTVHTCGCYLAFFPTEAMPREALPQNWSTSPQSIYGFTLPSILRFPNSDTANRITFTLESEIHRISDITVTDNSTRQAIGQQVQMRMLPMLDLYSLPYQDKTVPFFETEGSRNGYVKNNTKILERLFISWWALDLHVGEDKAFSINDKSDTVFYTSLKFWARKDSDLKNFSAFLQYWGWQL
ncbi:MAG: hypothetical protein V2B20_27710 [Pseudomonadota bacterium]